MQRLKYVFVLAIASTLTNNCRNRERTTSRDNHPRVAAPLKTENLNSRDASELIVVDQFGYLPEMPKVAVVKVPPTRQIQPKTSDIEAPILSVRKIPEGDVVYQGQATLWCNGALDEASGDSGYWFDFTSVTSPGEYVIVDVKNHDESVRFSISTKAYRDVLVTALKAFYFNRANIAKIAPFACVGEKCWKLDSNYLGEGQDRNVRSVQDKGNRKTERDLSGGWWDAGDVNKYVTFARIPVHQLLTAFQERPQVFTDNFGIPESGNGVPDVLDEVKVELEWLKRMQPSDLGGAVLIKTGNAEYGDPVPDKSRVHRYYYPEPCSSATIATSGMFAHAALVFSSIAGQEHFAREMRERAEQAYLWQKSNPRSDNCDTGELKGGDSDRTLKEQKEDAVVAAIYLFALTGNPEYRSLIDSDYRLTRPFRDDGWSAYDPDQGDALMYYSAHPDANALVAAEIRKRRERLAVSTDIFRFDVCKDFYRSYLRKGSYHWGSNAVRANYGNSVYDLLALRTTSTLEANNYTERVLGLLQHFHGVNALSLVYLSNMQALGSERSVSEIFHAWFRDGDPLWDSAIKSHFGPAPGFVVGGPNAHYCENQQAACARSSLRRVPFAKAYRDFNTGWEPKSEYDRSWELSEPSIGYQSAYVKLVSKFVK